MDHLFALKRVCRGALMYCLYLALLNLATWNYLIVEFDNVEKDEYITLVFCVILPFISFFTMAGIFSDNDGYERDRYLLSVNAGKARSDIAATLKEKTFIIETAVLICLTFLTPVTLGHRTLFELIFGYGSTSYTSAEKHVFSLILAAAGTVMLFISKLEAKKFFIISRAEDRASLKFFNKTALMTAKAFLVYAIGCAVASATLPMFVSFFFMLKKAANINAIAIILLIVVAVIIFKYLRAVSGVKRFIKNFRRMCDEKGYMLSEMRKPFRCFLFARGGPDLSVEISGKKYFCKIYSFIFRPEKLYLDRGTAIILFKADLFGLNAFNIFLKNKYEFDPDGGTGVIVFIREPKSTYAGFGRDVRRLYNGDIVDGFKVYDADGITGAAERDCIDRKKDLE